MFCVNAAFKQYFGVRNMAHCMNTTGNNLRREQQRGFTCENCELCRSQAGLAVGEEGLRLMQGGVRNHRA